MPADGLHLFTDRDEEVALFDLLRGRDPTKPWPLLPILAFIAPGGSGKSTLIDQLIEQCNVNGAPAVPYARIDFTVPNAPKDLWSILVELRKQLQLQADGQDKHLTFPRFDLGVLITQIPTEDLSSFTPSQVQGSLSTGKQVFDSLTTAGSTLGFLVPYLPAVLAGIKMVGQIPAVQDTVQRILGRLGDSTDWKWYRSQLRMGDTTGMNDVLLRLYDLSQRGKPDREERVINELLPAAFAADLYGALVEATPPKAWSQKANVVIFLDGFQALQRSSSETAALLLQGLTTEPRKQGQTDPLLLVIGSRDPLTGMTTDEQPMPFARTVEDKSLAKQRAHELYAQWQHRPRALRRLQLKNLVLPFWLLDFGPDHTKSYLLKVGEREQTTAFAADDLVQAIFQVTLGQPLFLALAAEAVLEADPPLQPTTFQLLQAEVSAEIAPKHVGEKIGKYLLDLFLEQLPDAERQELIRCAVPRVLDVDVLRVLLPSLDTIDNPADERWHNMRKRSFLSAVDERRSVVHPVVRRLLLRRLPVSADPNKDFVQIHTQLKDYFTQLAARGEDGAGIEAAYHALALGDPEPAINLGILAQQSRLPLWEPLLEAVRQAPTDLLPNTTKARAENAFTRAQERREIQDAAAAVVLCTWLLSAANNDREKSARRRYNLGLAYSSLPAGDRTANLQHAIDCYQTALQVLTREDFPADWASTQNSLGQAYTSLPTGDRATNLQHAIAYFEAALQVPTREGSPIEWAAIQHNLGAAYMSLPTGDSATNLQHAIAYFEATLQVLTRESSPADWASTQNNLGAAYTSLPTGDRATNLQHAIAYFEAALQAYTREAFPADWAGTQLNLGTVYATLSSGDLATNLQHGIACYQAASHVYTREDFPAQWATIQNNLGNAYTSLPTGDVAANLQHAISYYEFALQVHTREAFPAEWARTQNNLGTVYATLSSGDRTANLQHAIDYYEAALQVRTREAFPVDYAMTQHNLGWTFVAYVALPIGDRAANLQRAIDCYQAAVEIFSAMHMDDYSQGATRNLEWAKGTLQEMNQHQQTTPPQQTQPGEEIF